jgi:hypothetical protein
MAAYNYTRFDSVTEFGMSYQLMGTNMQNVSLFSLKYLPVALYGYLFTMPTFNYDFPFVHLNAQVLPGVFDFEYWSEPLMGLLGLPILWLYLSKRVSLSRLWLEQNTEKLVGFFGALATLTMLMTNTGTNGRYTMEFFPVLLLLLYPKVVESFERKRDSSKNSNIELMNMTRALFIISVLVQFLVSLTGYGETFKKNSPEQFQFIEELLTFPILFLTQIFS